MAGLRRALVAVAAALALADASIVALALPPILVEFHTTITGVASIVGVYALVLALAILPARGIPEGPAGLFLFAAASVGCALSGALWVLLVFRALQAAGAAAALLTAFDVLGAGESRAGRRWWLGAALIGTAAGPAIGGALTEAFDWRAIFAVQAPLAVAAGLAVLASGRARVAAGSQAGVAGEPPSPGAAPQAPARAAVGSAPAAPPPSTPAAPAPAAAASAGSAPAAPPPAAPAPAAAASAGSAPAAPPPSAPPPSAPAPAAAASAGSAPAAPPPSAPPPSAPAPAAAASAGSAPAAPPPSAPAPAAAASAGSAPAAPPPSAPAPAATALRPEPHPAALGSLAALAFTAAAFTAVLFLLVIELVAGFAVSPGRAALGVTVLPLAALAAAAIPGPPRARALGGAVLIAGGAGALAFLPEPGIAWTLVPQVLAGAGMGLALPALSPERTVAEAARTLVARHAGIVVVLAILAPVATARLSSSTDRAILQGAGLVLDAQIDPLQKLQLAPGLLAGVNKGRPRASLTEAVDKRRADFADDTAVYDRLARRLDDVVVSAVEDAFRIAYLIAAGLALVGAALLFSAWRRPAIVLAAAAAAGCVAVYAVQAQSDAPPDVVLHDPCQPRELPNAGGFAGAIQAQALKQLDQAACKLGVSREELALAIFDRKRAAKFQRDHGVDPRSTISLLSLLGG